jgi:hypothetical protein
VIAALVPKAGIIFTSKSIRLRASTVAYIMGVVLVGGCNRSIFILWTVLYNVAKWFEKAGAQENNAKYCHNLLLIKAFRSMKRKKIVLAVVKEFFLLVGLGQTKSDSISICDPTVLVVHHRSYSNNNYLLIIR